MSDKNGKSLEDWIGGIQDKEMPIFGKTVQSIVNVSEDDLAPASKLAKVVLQDASMTARVLKLVNSIYYNPGNNPIGTVSRAVVVMGFHTIRNICLSISLVDSVVGGANKDQLTLELARAIHAAVQARELAVQMRDGAPEEVFVAALLHNIGDMAFWCFGGKDCERLAHLMKQPGYTPEKAQRELLGFSLRDLSLGLVKEWGISELLLETMRDPARASVRGKSVLLSRELAQVTEQNGWESKEAKEVIKEISKYTDLRPEVLEKKLHGSAQEAAKIAGFYGAGRASLAIPLPGKTRPEKAPEPLVVSDYPEPDPMLQLQILRELSQLMERKPDFNLIMEMVMEGIHRGVGFDRTLFSLVTPDRVTLYGKFALGKGNETLTNNFRFNRNLDPSNLFFAVLEKRAEYWVDPAKSPALAPFLTPAIRQVVGLKPFFCSAVAVNNKGIGILYADRSLSGRALDDNSFTSFKHFATQTSMLLTQRTTGK